MPIDWPRLQGDAVSYQRVLATGGAGLIGPRLAETMLAHGAKVIVLGNLSGEQRENGPTATEFIEKSILPTELVKRCAEGAQIVSHEAALGSVPAIMEAGFRDVRFRKVGRLPALTQSMCAVARKLR